MVGSSPDLPGVISITLDCTRGVDAVGEAGMLAIGVGVAWVVIMSGSRLRSIPAFVSSIYF